MDGDGLAAFHALVCPIVVPVCACGEINFAAGDALLSYRSYKERRAKHVFVTDVGNVRIAGEIHEQRAHEGRAGFVCLVAE